MAQVKPREQAGTAAPVHPRRRRSWPWPLNYYQTAVGKKWAMAITGLIGMGFVAGHMFGNLKLYAEAAEINAYAIGLREFGYPILPKEFALWIARSVLLVALVVHVHAAWSIWRQNRRARTVNYQSKRDYIAANWASRTMVWTGPIILLFIAFHLADLTFGWANPSFEYGEVHANVIATFERWPVSAFYIVANLALGVHLYHGAWSLFQSMGVNHPNFNQARRAFAVLFAAAIVIGNISFPIAVLAGVID